MNLQEQTVLRLMGWGPVQTRAIAKGMDGMPCWKPEWHARMADYGSANERHGINCQAGFLTWTLENTHQSIGVRLRAAETDEQADAALKELWEAIHA